MSVRRFAGALQCMMKMRCFFDRSFAWEAPGRNPGRGARDPSKCDSGNGGKKGVPERFTQPDDPGGVGGLLWKYIVV